MDKKKYIFSYDRESGMLGSELFDFYYALGPMVRHTYVWHMRPEVIEWLCIVKDSEDKFIIDPESLKSREELFTILGRPIYFSEHAPENGIEFRAYR